MKASLFFFLICTTRCSILHGLFNCQLLLKFIGDEKRLQELLDQFFLFLREILSSFELREQFFIADLGVCQFMQRSTHKKIHGRSQGIGQFREHIRGRPVLPPLVAGDIGHMDTDGTGELTLGESALGSGLL